MTDATNLIHLMQETKLDEVYNLAVQSRVQVGFETPLIEVETGSYLAEEDIYFRVE